MIQSNISDVTPEEFAQCNQVLAPFNTIQIGKALIYLREINDLSQSELAKKIKQTNYSLSRQSISKIENGDIVHKERIVKYIAIILKALNQTASFFKSLIIA